jgi:hypothetical protein
MASDGGDVEVLVLDSALLESLCHTGGQEGGLV